MNTNSTYENLTFNQIIDSAPKQNYSIAQYHKILCPDYPTFLDPYIKLPLLQRLSGIGLLCGSDWTKLFHNRFYYSRLDHSIGVALIVWHFTHNKAQTIAGLLHDVSTSVFSHVSDFRKGDALTQTLTEGPTATMIRADKALQQLLTQDGLTSQDVEDYHKYPVADNEIPQLSADRLEYMYPSGMVLEGSWTMEEIARTYNDLCVMKNEADVDELCFNNLETAELYCRRFCMTGHILQMNEDKLTLHLLGQIMNKAVEAGLVNESDFMELSENQILQKLEKGFSSSSISPLVELCRNLEPVVTIEPRRNLEPTEISNLHRLYNTFRNMEKIEHTNEPLPQDKYFCVNLKVKQRYINPLVKMPGTEKAVRLYDISPVARKIIDDFKAYEDTAYGCVKLI